MGTQAAVVLGSVASAAVTASAWCLVYRAYLRTYLAALPAILATHETAPLAAETLAALAPVPPWRRVARR